MAKGKEHKKYEFGTKASVVLTRTGGIIVGAVAHKENLYDGHTLPEVLQQTESLTGSVPAVAIVDRGYRGTRRIGETEILVPGPKPKEQTPHHTRLMRQRFRRRCAVEPVIGHLKSDYRLARNSSRASPVIPATCSWPPPHGTSKSGSTLSSPFASSFCAH